MFAMIVVIAALTQDASASPEIPVGVLIDTFLFGGKHVFHR